MKKRVTPPRKSELRAALGSAKAAFVGVGTFSGLINILMLTGALFMLEVYDRVLPSRSVPTLVALCVLAAILLRSRPFWTSSAGKVPAYRGHTGTNRPPISLPAKASP